MTFDATKWETEMLEKITSGEQLSESELRNLVEYQIAKEEGDDRRWYRDVTSLIKFGGRYFLLNWDHGLTENQENEFHSQPVEVFNPTETEKIVRRQNTTWFTADGSEAFTISKEVQL